MLLLHLIDFSLLLLHNIGQLELVLNLGGGSPLRTSFLGGVIRLQHLRLPTRLVQLDRGSGLLLISGILRVGLAYLVSHPYWVLRRGLLLLVHFY